MSLSDSMREQIAQTFVRSYKNDIFKHGTYYTNGKCLLYVPKWRSEEYAFKLNVKELDNFCAARFVDIQDLIPPSYQYTPDYEALIYSYRKEFMRVHKLEAYVLYQYFSKNDILKWISQKYPKKIDKCDQIAIEFIKTTLLNIEDVFSYKYSPLFDRQE